MHALSPRCEVFGLSKCACRIDTKLGFAGRGCVLGLPPLRLLVVGTIVSYLAEWTLQIRAELASKM